MKSRKLLQRYEMMHNPKLTGERMNEVNEASPASETSPIHGVVIRRYWRDNMNDEYQSMAASAICHAATQAGYSWQIAAGIAESVAIEQKRPFMMLKPRLFPDGNQWCALYGENLQDGVCAFGDTPDAASKQFDIEWLNAKCGANRGV